MPQLNENVPPNPDVIDTIVERVREIAPTLNRYPDREHIKLRQAFSDYLAKSPAPGLTSASCGARTGRTRSCSSCSAFGGPGRTALSCDPTYSMYPEYARDTFTGWKVVHRNADFTLDVDRTIEAINEIEAVHGAADQAEQPDRHAAAARRPNACSPPANRRMSPARRARVHPILVIDEVT